MLVYKNILDIFMIHVTKMYSICDHKGPVLFFLKICLIPLWYTSQKLICLWPERPCSIFSFYEDIISFCFITDLCRGTPCENDGTCIEDEDDYTCTCVPGFTGRNCQTSNEASLWTQPILCKGPVPNFQKQNIRKYSRAAWTCTKQWIKGNVVNFICETKSVSNQDASFW